MKKNFKCILIVVIAIGLIFLSSILFNHKPMLLENIIKDGGMFLNHLFALPIKEDSKNMTCDDTNKEMENQINEMKKILSINNILSEYENINCVVISHDPGYWYDKITINKGSNDGIKEGMAVINNNGLLGKVVSTTGFNSVVQLLTSENINKISVKLENNDDYIYGLITNYNKEDNIYLVDGISTGIEVDSKVTTTGFGDIFPAGILVGKVVNSKSDNYDLARTIEIKPSVDFNNINIVSVLKRKVDQ